ncbi:hypothetical protein MHYP_G00070550 [Metynnis hypsauchen]
MLFQPAQQAYSTKSPLHSVPACSGLPFEWEFQVIIILPVGRQHTALITLFPLCVTPRCLTLEESHVGRMQERLPHVNQSREPEEQTLCGPASESLMMSLDASSCASSSSSWSLTVLLADFNPK